MGFVEYFDETTGSWTNLEDVPLFDTINCQLCNEPVQIRELANISSEPVNGIVTWQCAKCNAVNG